ncbi:MAG: WecB/TagA/CpsF family glycosyltransferase [Acidimicrobiales bacterium]
MNASPERTRVLDIPVDFLDLGSVVDQVVSVAQERRSFQVATVNLDFLVNSRRDDEVDRILRSADLNIADGAPVVWAGRWLGARGAQRVAGVDLVLALAAEASRHGLRLFMLGGEHGSAADAASALTAAHPELSVSHFEPPRTPLEDIEDATIIERIAAADPHILLVAFGHPKQEKWIRRNLAALPMVCIGVGGSLDLIAGRHPRAPEWMQNVGLEWSFRLACEPRRLARRYASDGVSAVRELFPWVLTQRLSRG